MAACSTTYAREVDATFMTTVAIHPPVFSPKTPPQRPSSAYTRTVASREAPKFQRPFSATQLSRAARASHDSSSASPAHTGQAGPFLKLGGTELKHQVTGYLTKTKSRKDLQNLLASPRSLEMKPLLDDAWSDASSEDRRTWTKQIAPRSPMPHHHAGRRDAHVMEGARRAGMAYRGIPSPRPSTAGSESSVSRRMEPSASEPVFLAVNHREPPVHGSRPSSGKSARFGAFTAPTAKAAVSTTQASSSAAAAKSPLAAAALGSGASMGDWGFALGSMGGAPAKKSALSNRADANFAKVRAAVFKEERRKVLFDLRTKYAAALWYTDTTGDEDQMAAIKASLDEERHKAFLDLDTPAELVITEDVLTREARTASRFKTDEEPPLIESKPGWWKPPAPVVQASRRFDDTIRQRVGVAKRLHGLSLHDPEWIELNRAMRDQARSVRRARYVAPYQAPAVIKQYDKKVYKKKPKPKAKVVWWPGIWRPRSKWCDSRDYHDHSLVQQQRFNIDWDLAIKACNLIKIVMRADDGDDDGIEDEDGDGIPDEVEEVGDLLYENCSWLYPLFLSYATLDGTVTSIDFNEWSALMKDLKLANNRYKFAKTRDLDRLFLAINTGTTMASRNAERSGVPIKQPGRDEKTAINRFEFLGLLTHLCIMRFVQSGELADVSMAMHKLLTEMRINAHPSMCLDPDVFRREHCYTEGVTLALEKHEASLRGIFVAAAYGYGGGAGSKLLSLEEWEGLTSGLGFVGIDISERDGRFAFVWSRMAVIDGRTERGFLRECCLPFEGFLEALVRVAVMKALPTDEEIAASGSKHAGEHMEKLKKDDEEMYDAMLRERAIPWGAEPTLQSTAKCVKHTLDIMIHTIETETAGTDNLKLTEREVQLWLKQKGLRP